MARPAKIVVAALNISTQPHTADGYVDLLRKAAGAGLAGKFWGNRAGEFGPVKLETWDEGEEKLQVVTGEIHLYTDFDSAKEWFNRPKKSGLPADRIANIGFLTDNKPEHDSIPFAFIVKHHEFFFENTMSPRNMVRLLEQLLAGPAKAAGQQLFINVIQQKQALDRVFGMTVLTELRITLRPPNPDDGEEMEKEVLRRLNEERAISLEKILKSEEGLKPTPETKAEAALATRNGRVVGKGLDGPTKAELQKETVDTADHPRTHSSVVPPRANRKEVFFRTVIEFVRQLRKK